VARTVTLIPGDGIGPDVTNSVQEVIDALGVDIEWEIAEAGETVMEEKGTPLPVFVRSTWPCVRSWISTPTSGRP
jgi:isocitrate dehydrogenase (NAD+)